MEISESFLFFGFLLLYTGVVFVWPSYKVWQKTGVNPFVFSGSDSLHDYAGRQFKIVMLLIFLATVVKAFLPDLYPYLAPIGYLNQAVIYWTGWTLMALSLGWIVWAQRIMGLSWRIGIDNASTSSFVERGPFGYSRNPVFLGMAITLLGIFLVMPNAITLLTVYAGIVALQVQIRLEEEFLLKKYAGQYDAYKNRVRRWI